MSSLTAQSRPLSSVFFVATWLLAIPQSVDSFTLEHSALESLMSTPEHLGSRITHHIRSPQPKVSSRDTSRHITIQAHQLKEPLSLDGRLDEDPYRIFTPVSDFIQQEPNEGHSATEKTEVWVFFDSENIYISARCWDSQPEQMIVNELRRDHNMLAYNENFAVVLDTFHDRRNSFMFHTNPLGGLTDATTTDEREFNKDWNTVWRVETSRFSEGWIAEFEIPFKSLRYKEGNPQVWGINFRRRVLWKNEISFLTPIPASYGLGGISKVSEAATLVGILAPSGTKNIEIKPYVISSITTDRSLEQTTGNDFHSEIGFDTKYGLTRSLIADLTYNTDFAQVEADEQQVNLTRFSLFFPEKREFFLEGQGIFSFGGGGQRGRPRGGFRPGQSEGPPNNIPIVFFSRRIGFSNGMNVPILAGGRLTGRVGPYSIGTLNIQTGDSETASASSTNFSVLRLKRNILRRSNIGIIFTNRSTMIDSTGTNQAVGFDGTFSFFKNINIDGYYAQTSTTGISDQNKSYRGAFDYSADRYGVQLEHLTVGDHFNPQIGFVRRKNFRQNSVYFRFSPRLPSSSFIRKIGLESGFDHIENLGGGLESQQAQITLRMDLENGDQWNIDYERNFEFLEEIFPITPSITIQTGSYYFTNFRASYNFGPQRKLSGQLMIQKGTFFNGHRDEIKFRGRIELMSRLSVEPAAQISWIDLPRGSFSTKLLGARTAYSVSPRMFISALTQYVSNADTLTNNIRFRWEYQPGSDIFLVYSDGRDTTPIGFPLLKNRSVAIKFTRLFRF